uniref:Uncharacterized protein n=1 Tax=Corethron hystrix TaxID=216773 RepID=A0A6U5FVP6_9STRA|mmetsp:Transcript_24467/g.55875  ORF Transcript_24467/g.55875 Transcript_24467/m.55875 type:complete len:178 (+) Transcript_24467:151-684(+)|eukprot:CAMPEP_0113313166 /NCGR_PEP_ID=MMETSP0010_2-20120614/9697_1 /TAXON_ID=216773 ORGANISM="Corethron hystrix, Strain 308" /NCGR_SAMPLE_ID=MMETSP0010_2 /ASSEMBLY_ACC=CAM_ASM_000155 /LENGTH=177 /DNA_ID=CAMNT_0000169121 /DNA_START=131 /DNA_END=664 /DNA_ORIENTATION=- /assembly_acc=CAM_ASM_000155
MSCPPRPISAAPVREQHVSPGVVAVDTSQFRNVEVGVGYCARGVVRQPCLRGSGHPEGYRVVDMTAVGAEEVGDAAGSKGHEGGTQSVVKEMRGRGTLDGTEKKKDERGTSGGIEKKKEGKTLGLKKKGKEEGQRSRKKQRNGRKEVRKTSTFAVEEYFSNPLFRKFRKEISLFLTE